MKNKKQKEQEKVELLTWNVCFRKKQENILATIFSEKFFEQDRFEFQYDKRQNMRKVAKIIAWHIVNRLLKTEEVGTINIYYEDDSYEMLSVVEKFSKVLKLLGYGIDWIVNMTPQPEEIVEHFKKEL